MRWGHSFRFLLTFGLVHAARPGLEPSVSQAKAWSCKKYQASPAENVLKTWWKKWWKEQKECRCKDRFSIGLFDRGGRRFPSKGCGAPAGSKTFKVTKNGPDPKTCQCVEGLDAALDRTIPVEVSALKFCSAFVKHVYDSKLKEHSGDLGELGVAESLLSPQLCKEVLIGTARTGEWYSQAAQLSKHPDTQGLGHLDPLVKLHHHHLLKHVCNDECEEIVNATLANLRKMTMVDVRRAGVPLEQTCADHVVRRVEAEILGCCGRSCGWNDRSCTAWPFFNKSEKVMWLEECCTELNVLNGSSRERMCNSVLTPEQVQRVSKLNTKAKSGTDVGGAYIGQDQRLLWTTTGLSEFKMTKPKDGDLVDSKFLEEHPDVQREGMQKPGF